MRIMLVTDQYRPMIGGVPTVTHNLAINLARRGHQVRLVAPSAGLKQVEYIEQAVHIYRFSSFAWPFYQGLRIPFFPFIQSMYCLIKKTRPDILHIHAPIVVGKVARYLGDQLHIPVIATNHFLPMNLSKSFGAHSARANRFNDNFYRYLIQFYNRCTYVTTPTVTALKLLHNRGLSAPSCTISNGIDLDKFSPSNPDNAIRRRFRLPEDRPLALHVNRLSKEKRTDVLLSAATQMQSNGHIAIVGAGPQEAALRAQANHLHLNERVSFLGFVNEDDLLALRRASDVFVNPSEAELQSLATMEAMACGLPVIAANAFALPELVHHNVNGFLFERGNSSMLAHQLDLLLMSGELRSHMKMESLKIIAEHNYSTIITQWEHLYNECVTKTSQKALRRR